MILVLLLRSSPTQSVSQSYNYEYFYHIHGEYREDIIGIVNLAVLAYLKLQPEVK